MAPRQPKIDRDSVKTVVVIGSKHKPAGQDVARALIAFFRHAEIEVRDDVGGVADLRELCAGADLALSVGGDGTMLSTARRMQGHPIPTIGVNTGKLGFLAEFTEQELREWIARRAELEFRIVGRMLLKCVVRQGGRREVRYALNDAVIHQGLRTRLALIDMWVGQEHATQYAADGLVVATPVGSTAYSLSLGGPILTPGLRSFVVTPIAPHSLTDRALVIEATRKLRFKIRRRLDEVAVVLDGHEVVPLEPDAELEVSRAGRDFPLVSRAERPYYDLLRHKLQWGTTPHETHDESGRWRSRG